MRNKEDCPYYAPCGECTKIPYAGKCADICGAKAPNKTATTSSLCRYYAFNGAPVCYATKNAERCYCNGDRAKCENYTAERK